MIGSLPSFRFSRSPGLTFIAFVGVLCLAYEAAQLVIEGDVNTLVMSGLVFVGLAVVVAILNDVGSSRVDLQACKLEYSIVSPK